MMRGLFRPSRLLAVAAAVTVGAFLITWATGVFSGGSGPAGPLPVAANEREIVWLYPATNPAAWDRFVDALKRSADNLQRDLPGITAQVVHTDAFPRHSFATPQVALSLPGGSRLLFRWYKLTNDWKTRDWISALLQRKPPPLAIIGGSSSDTARKLAMRLAEMTADVPAEQRPLLLLTQATADRVETEPDALLRLGPEGEGEPTSVPLLRLYPGRTFRFCFSNSQMAAAVTHFIWLHDDLRPDRDPAYTVQWEDDSYSHDLINGFSEALQGQVAESAARQWSWVTSTVAAGLPWGAGGPFPLDRAGPRASSFTLSEPPPPFLVDSSVGPFSTPNRFESEVANALAELLTQPSVPPRPPQERPLLILTGQVGPSRRFLRAMERFIHQPAVRFVVATGDSIAFNTVYRDRQVAWHIQDLPYHLVFFCHHNPIDRDAGFRPLGEAPAPSVAGSATTGTEDTLLYEDVIEALVHGAAGSAPNAAALGERLRALQVTPAGRIAGGAGGQPLFDEAGGRRHGTGEHVVYLRPSGGGGILAPMQPRATIEVWAWREEPGRAGGHSWQRVGRPLRVTYDGFAPDGGGAHDAD
jgi:hypothetical protein